MRRDDIVYPRIVNVVLFYPFIFSGRFLAHELRNTFNLKIPSTLATLICSTTFPNLSPFQNANFPLLLVSAVQFNPLLIDSQATLCEHVCELCAFVRSPHKLPFQSSSLKSSN